MNTQKIFEPVVGTTMSLSFADYLSQLDLREPQQFKNMVIVPIFNEVNDGVEYLTLTEALQQQVATITEISPGGHVPNLKLRNDSGLGLLLINGEELIGARQNRTLNTSILVAAKSETIIPVSCTEAGRWSYNTMKFAHAGYVSPHKLRKVKSSSVAASLQEAKGHRSDQHAVWGEIAHYCLAAKAHSPTSAMQHAVEAKGVDLKEYLEHFKPSPGQKGLLVLVNGEVAGADVVSSARAYQVLHSKLVQSYALEALFNPRPSAVNDTPALQQARGFFERAKGATERVHNVVGCGQDHRFESHGVSGAALVVDSHIVHLNIYRN